MDKWKCIGWDPKSLNIFPYFAANRGTVELDKLEVKRLRSWRYMQVSDSPKAMDLWLVLHKSSFVHL